VEPISPRKLKPSVLTRLLNSTPRGEVISERQLLRHRNRAGYTVGDTKTVDLFRYVAWLTEEFLKPKSKPLSYEEVKVRHSERNAELVRIAQDIGAIPDVVNPQRKAAAEESFKFFCETYFPEVFYFSWSPDHLRVIEKIERAVRTGGLFAMAMPRGSGKTVLCQTAVVWAALQGSVPFVCLLAASAERARDLLENIMVWLETNPLLNEDFPEVCYPIRKLERITNRQRGAALPGRTDADRLGLQPDNFADHSGQQSIGCRHIVHWYERRRDSRAIARATGWAYRPSSTGDGRRSSND